MSSRDSRGYYGDKYGDLRAEARDEIRSRMREIGGEVCGSVWVRHESRVVLTCGKRSGHKEGGDYSCGRGIQIGSDGKRW